MGEYFIPHIVFLLVPSLRKRKVRTPLASQLVKLRCTTWAISDFDFVGFNQSSIHKLQGQYAGHWRTLGGIVIHTSFCANDVKGFGLSSGCIQNASAFRATSVERTTVNGSSGGQLDVGVICSGEGGNHVCHFGKPFRLSGLVGGVLCRPMRRICSKELDHATTYF